MNKYQVALRALIAVRRKLNIVIVGANDGKTNDPIFEFNKSKAHSTRVLLIEPNKLLLPFLKANYEFHPYFKIANCAIGSDGELTLYAVKEIVWDRFQPSYSKGWPYYRAPTGVTSAVKSHVEDALRQQDIDPENAIEVLEVPAKQMINLLRELDWPTPTDVLQIDAEGYDDVVIYNSNLEITQPKIIYFESHSMPAARLDALKRYLSIYRYRVYAMGGDSLAVQSRAAPLCLALNFLMLMHACLSCVMLRIKRVRDLF